MSRFMACWRSLVAPGMAPADCGGDGARGLYSAPEIAGQAATIRHLPAARLPGHGRGPGPPAPFTSGRGPGMNSISPSAGRGLDAAAVRQAVAAPPQEARKRPPLAPL